ncbi:hypothetical protein AOLI_G00056790 [Acnodon oligacanthus]
MVSRKLSRAALTETNFRCFAGEARLFCSLPNAAAQLHVWESGPTRGQRPLRVETRGVDSSTLLCIWFNKLADGVFLPALQQSVVGPCPCFGVAHLDCIHGKGSEKKVCAIVYPSDPFKKLRS